MMPYIRSGRLAYYRTTRPEFYQMAHSRNVAFALATGDVVNTVDADNWTGAGFARRVGELAGDDLDGIVLSKGAKLVDGRVGLSKKNWERLGGYDEAFVGYGYDDKDLLYRALASGLRLKRYGDEYCHRIRTVNRLKMKHLEQKDKLATARFNRALSQANIEAGRLRANAGRAWAVETVVKNFSDRIEVAMPARDD